MYRKFMAIGYELYMKPPLHRIAQDDLNVRFCICVKRSNLPGRPEIYQPICGQCRDPCRLRFVPDTLPKRPKRRRNNGGGGDNPDDYDN